MKTFRSELRTILFSLRNCPWAAQAPVQNVITEYEHLDNASSTPTQTRRVSLQIFHASRAIDSFLKQLANHEAHKRGRPINHKLTLGSSLKAIQNHKVGGRTFAGPTVTDIKKITDDRNLYLHSANYFPQDVVIQNFLSRTIRAIQEAVSFPP